MYACERGAQCFQMGYTYMRVYALQVSIESCSYLCAIAMLT